ncbi:hypothetical protein ES705_41955 [subsurface metagenome]
MQLCPLDALNIDDGTDAGFVPLSRKPSLSDVGTSAKDVHMGKALLREFKDQAILQGSPILTNLRNERAPGFLHGHGGEDWRAELTSWASERDLSFRFAGREPFNPDRALAGSAALTVPGLAGHGDEDDLVSFLVLADDGRPHAVSLTLKAGHTWQRAMSRDVCSVCGSSGMKGGVMRHTLRGEKASVRDAVRNW